VNNKKWRKWCKFVSPFLFNNTYGLPVLTIDTKSPNQVFNVWLFDLQSICAKLEVKTKFLPNDNIRKYLLYMKNSWTKNVFWDVNKMKRRKWSKFFWPLLFNNTWLTCDHNGPQTSKSTILFDSLNYRLFVLNTGLKRDSLQLMIFVNVLWTLCMGQLKTCFETSITRNDVYGVSLFYRSYLIHLMAYLCSQWSPKVQIK
jgi:hypothetical protein